MARLSYEENWSERRRQKAVARILSVWNMWKVRRRLGETWLEKEGLAGLALARRRQKRGFVRVLFETVVTLDQGSLLVEDWGDVHS